MNLNTGITSRAVKRPRRSSDVTRSTYAQYYILVCNGHIYVSNYFLDNFHLHNSFLFIYGYVLVYGSEIVWLTPLFKG
jgi:hypothetical protein